MGYAPFSSPGEHFFYTVQLPQQQAAMAAAAAEAAERARLEALRVERRALLLLLSDDQ